MRSWFVTVVSLLQDVQYGDIDYMEGKKDFTWDRVKFAGLDQYIHQLRAEGTRFVVIKVSDGNHSAGTHHMLLSGRDTRHTT